MAESLLQFALGHDNSELSVLDKGLWEKSTHELLKIVCAILDMFAMVGDCKIYLLVTQSLQVVSQPSD